MTSCAQPFTLAMGTACLKVRGLSAPRGTQTAAATLHPFPLPKSGQAERGYSVPCLATGLT